MRRLAIVITCVGLATGRAWADPFDPTKFPSLGNLSASPLSATTWTIDTGNGLTTPTLTEGVGGTVLDGTLTAQPNGGPTVAVFDFGSIALSGPLTINATGSLPVALRRRTDATIGAGGGHRPQRRARPGARRRGRRGRRGQWRRRRQRRRQRRRRRGHPRRRRRLRRPRRRLRRPGRHRRRHLRRPRDGPGRRRRRRLQFQRHRQRRRRRRGDRAGRHRHDLPRRHPLRRRR